MSVLPTCASVIELKISLTAVGSGSNQNLLISQVLSPGNNVLKLRAVVFADGLQQPRPTSRVRVMVCHNVVVHTLVRFGTDPVWGSPVHETLTEVDTVRGNIGGTNNIHRHVSITPGCLKQ